MQKKKKKIRSPIIRIIIFVLAMVSCAAFIASASLLSAKIQSGILRKIHHKSDTTSAGSGDSSQQQQPIPAKTHASMNTNIASHLSSRMSSTDIPSSVAFLVLKDIFRQVFIGISNFKRKIKSVADRFVPLNLFNNKAKVATIKVGETSVPSSVRDHLEMDIRLVKGLTEEQRAKCIIAAEGALQKGGGPSLELMAGETHTVISPHFAYRYYISIDWKELYNGRSIEDAIIDTITWRKAYGIHRLAIANRTRVVEMIRNGLAYTSLTGDKRGRSIVHLKLARNLRLEDAKDYIDLLMYTMERADRHCETLQSGEFIAIVDLEGFTWSKTPPADLWKDCIGMLKRHYPYRLSAVYIVNTSSVFQLIWHIVKPLLSKKAIGKVSVLGSVHSDPKTRNLLVEQIGAAYLEDVYGGEQKEIFHPDKSTEEDVKTYLKQGYWSTAAR